MVAVIIAVILSSAPSVILVACTVAVAVVVVNTRSPSTCLDGVPGVSVWPETALDRQSCGRGMTASVLIPGERWVRLMRE
jgi:hypothetical protein